MAEPADRVHVVTVVYDFQGRGLHSCLECHYAGFSPPPLPCPGRPEALARTDTQAVET